MQGTDITQTFAVENTGTSTLNVGLISSSMADFTVSSAIGAVAAGTTQTFTVTLSGAATGNFSGTISIASDDADENPFTFPVTGVIAVPLTLVSSSPSANGTNILACSNIILDFDTDVSLSSIHNGTTSANAVYDDKITIIGNQSGQIEGIYSVGADNSIVIFNPSSDFLAGEKVSVIISDLVLGTGGEIAIPTSFSFTSLTGPFEGAFIEKVSGIAGMADGSFDWGDYDNDGDLDVVVVGFDPSFNASATIYNNMNGTFSDIGAGLTGVFFSSTDWGDYDNDGDLDLVIAGADNTGTNRFTTIYQNNGGVFTDIGAGLQGVDYSSVDWGDYDNDGDLDLVVLGRYSFSPSLASTTIYQNNGGVFTDIGAGLQPLNNGSADWGDYDADGDLDLIVTGFNSDWSARFTILYDNNNGVFTDHLDAIPDMAWGDVDWGDYDNDGDLDLLMSGDGSVLTYTSIYNNAGGVFSDIGAGFPTTSEGSVRWGDYDGDGDLDVVITGQDYSTSTEITNIYNNSGGVFADINAGLQTVYFTGLADWGDFDGDGDLDILVAGESTSTPSSTLAVLYENTVIPPPTITSFNPASSLPGGTISIIGTNFTSATAVSFGGTAASSFTIDSPTNITAVVGAGSSGNVAITTGGGTATLAGFVFLTPEINLYQGNDNTGTLLADAQAAAVDFGTALQGSDITQTFAIENTGTITLNVGTISSSGSDFTVSSAIGAVAAGTTQTFTVTLSGAATGSFSSTISIASDDADENPFTFPVTGVITAPEINVYVGNDNTGTPLTNAQLTAIDFGNSVQGTDITQTFAVENTGTSTLNVGLISSSMADFTVSSAIGAVAAGTTQTFTVTLSGAATGSFSSTISIASDDADENPFTFPVTGLITAPDAPIIQVFYNSGTINTDVNFGSEEQGKDIVLEFVIENTGTADLILTSISSSNQDFTIANISFPVTLAPNGTQPLKITGNSTQIGTISTTLMLNSNDPATPSYTFSITGTIIESAVEIVVTDPDTNTNQIVIANDNINLGQTTINQDLEKVFTIENLSSLQLIQINNISIDNEVFSITDKPVSILPNATEPFTILLVADKVGVYTGTVSISTTNTTITFEVTGEVLPGDGSSFTVYNVVTPNGDNIHDYFKIVNIDTYPNNKVTIYNRWGDKVYETTGYDNKSVLFTGESNFNGSQKLETGNYYFTIEKGNGENAQTGFLFLKR